MKFLERSLETILYAELEYCRQRGLSLERNETKMFRQLNLQQYGIPDLVHLGYDARAGKVLVRIIECKRDIVDAATYGQACRYKTALSSIFGCVTGRVQYELVLIGQRVNAKGDFWHMVDRDDNCKVYTFAYMADGIKFTYIPPCLEYMDDFGFEVVGKSTDMLYEWERSMRGVASGLGIKRAIEILMLES